MSLRHLYLDLKDLGVYPDLFENNNDVITWNEVDGVITYRRTSKYPSPTVKMVDLEPQYFMSSFIATKGSNSVRYTRRRNKVSITIDNERCSIEYPGMLKPWKLRLGNEVNTFSNPLHYTKLQDLSALILFTARTIRDVPKICKQFQH